jgi:hypothetical protein
VHSVEGGLASRGVNGCMQPEISSGNWIKVNEGSDSYRDFLHTFVATE